MLANIALTAVLVTALVSLTIGRWVRRRSRAAAILICGGLLPLSLVVIGIFYRVQAMLQPPAALGDMISRDGVFIVLGVLTLPLTMLTALALLWWGRRRSV